MLDAGAVYILRASAASFLGLLTVGLGNAVLLGLEHRTAALGLLCASLGFLAEKLHCDGVLARSAILARAGLHARFALGAASAMILALTAWNSPTLLN